MLIVLRSVVLVVELGLLRGVRGRGGVVDDDGGAPAAHEVDAPPDYEDPEYDADYAAADCGAVALVELVEDGALDEKEVFGVCG